MKNSIRPWSTVAVVAAMLLVSGCSDDDDVFNVPSVPVEQAVEAGLDEALITTVVPLVTFMDAIGDLLGSGAKSTLLAEDLCPDTSEWCITGSVSCTETEFGPQFDFDQCQIVTGDAPFTVDGIVRATPGTTVLLTLTDLVVAGSPPMSGTGTIDVLGCAYFVDVDTQDASVFGTVVACDSDEYPTGDVLTIAFSDILVTLVFDGTNIVGASATQNGTPVAACTIDLDSEPLSSSCNAI